MIFFDKKQQHNSNKIKSKHKNICQIQELKEIEHRKLAWKVFILKYDLGKSLSKEMWCQMADTKTFLDYIFKMHVIWGKSFLCLWTRKWFPLIMNGIL